MAQSKKFGAVAGAAMAVSVAATGVASADSKLESLNITDLSDITSLATDANINATDVVSGSPRLSSVERLYKEPWTFGVGNSFALGDGDNKGFFLEGENTFMGTNKKGFAGIFRLGSESSVGLRGNLRAVFADLNSNKEVGLGIKIPFHNSPVSMALAGYYDVDDSSNRGEFSVRLGFF